MLKVTMVTLGVAALIAVTTTMSASAESSVTAYSCADNAYANGRIVTVDSPVVSPGQTTTVTWSAGYFMPGASVTISASGGSGSTPTVSVGSASGSGSATGNADGAGGITASVAIPADATGRVDIVAMSGEPCGGVSVTIASNTPPTDGALGGDVTPGTTSAATTAVGPTAKSAVSQALASTGGDLPTVLLISGGAAVVFGAILIGARTRARRNMAE